MIEGKPNLLPRDGRAYFVSDVLTPGESDHFFERLMVEIDWQQESLQVFGKRVAVPRLTAWFGDVGYEYSGIDHPPQPLTAPLVALQEVAQGVAQHKFNGVLLNLYRDGQDGVSWHADDEASLGRNPVIASLNLGCERRFLMKHRKSGERVEVGLCSGSCLVMAGEMQAHWVHCVPKTRRPVSARINLTFRAMAKSY